MKRLLYGAAVIAGTIAVVHHLGQHGQHPKGHAESTAH
jgi:hypothetical protein